MVDMLGRRGVRSNLVNNLPINLVAPDICRLWEEAKVLVLYDFYHKKRWLVGVKLEFDEWQCGDQSVQAYNRRCGWKDATMIDTIKIVVLRLVNFVHLNYLICGLENKIVQCMVTQHCWIGLCPGIWWLCNRNQTNFTSETWGGGQCQWPGEALGGGGSQHECGE